MQHLRQPRGHRAQSSMCLICPRGQQKGKRSRVRSSERGASDDLVDHGMLSLFACMRDMTILDVFGTSCYRADLGLVSCVATGPCLVDHDTWFCFLQTKLCLLEKSKLVTSVVGLLSRKSLVSRFILLKKFIRDP